MEARKDYAYFLIRLTLDAATIMASWFLSYYLRFFVIPGGIGEPFWLFARLSFLVLALCLFFLNRNRLYSTRHYTSWLEEIQLIFYSSLQSFLGVVVFLYFFYPVKVSRVSIAVYFVIVTLFLILERITIKNILGSILSDNMSKTVLLVGRGNILEKFVAAEKNSSHKGTVILGQYDGGSEILQEYKQYNENLLELIGQLEPDTIVIGYPKNDHEREKEIMTICYDLLQTVILIPNLPFSYIGSQIMEYQKLPVIYLNHISLSSFQKVGKRIFDFFLSLIGAIALSPLLLIVALLVKLTSPGPIFYRQTRITEHGRAFTMLKFRSMTCSNSLNNNCWTEKNDPRVTIFGKFIRCTSLDELPQLFNVLKGDMSLIGPRPERPELVDKFIQEIPGYQLRHKVKAGVSGWAQVNGWRGNTSLARRIECDLFYIRNWSFSLDIKIMFMTFIKGFINKNAY